MPRSPRSKARWQSGYAAACKAVYLGSIPGLASIFFLLSPADSDPLIVYHVALASRPGGEMGRRKGLKIPRRQLRAGSSPAPGTTTAC